MATSGRPRPRLDAFAADALTFNQARSTAGWTLPGHASMLTGLYPSRHGAHLAGGWLKGESIDGRRNVAYPLAADKTTLAELLRDRGYTTGGFVANFSYLYRDFGLAQGFQLYEDAPGLLFRVRPPVVRFVQQTFDPGFGLKPYRTAQDINALALGWLDGAPAGRPVFAFVNYMEPHQPWLAPPPHDRWVWELPQAKRLATKDLYTHAVKEFSPEELAFINANYDGQVAAMDAGAGRAGRCPQGARPIRQRADHRDGRSRRAAGRARLRRAHGPHALRALLHIPMVVKFPGAAHPRGRLDDPVQNLDVTPTVLREAGVPVPADMQGQPLREVKRPTIAEEDINPFLVADYGDVYNRAMRVVVDGPWKLISTSKGQRMLFDLSKDPQEKNDLAAAEPERVQELAQRLESTVNTKLAAAPATGTGGLMTAGGHDPSADEPCVRRLPSRGARRRCAKRAGAGPVVSVVMPVYNAKATLEECLTRLFQSASRGSRSSSSMTAPQTAPARSWSASRCASSRRRAGSGRRWRATRAPAVARASTSSSSTPTS